MKNYRSYPGYLAMPVFLFLMVPLLAFWFNPEIISGQVWVLLVWVTAMAGISILLQNFFFKAGRKSGKLWLIIPAAMLLLALAWFFTLRVSSEIVGPAKAWDAKWVSLMIVLLYSGGGYFLNYLIREGQLSVTKLDNQLSMKELELDFMKNQLNPHFLFNSLNNIAATIMVNKEMALDYTFKLSELLRYQVGISGRETVPVDEEIAFIRNFLDIEKLRLGGRCEINFTADSGDPMVLIPPLLLHPLIEHALRKSLGLNGKSVINIRLTSSREVVKLEITNSLPENPAYKNLAGTGVEMLKKRLTLLFPDKYTLHTEKKTNEYELVLEVRLGKNHSA
ncbi:histidine kinase [Lentimicrobium sp.]|uniref:sensor histidine kinase n=2 Tax=Lentimicrobium sp. TaxID=2034841 RepID=UPI002C09FAAC|nr:histidine kinase [Lentimicrobium sp.]HRW68357.1 histidine kinase [Lentimicrobium sp.]